MDYKSFKIKTELNIDFKNNGDMAGLVLMGQEYAYISLELENNLRHIRIRKGKFNNEIDEIIEVLLRKNKNNPVLVGKAGVGKTAIIEELAYRINKKQVPNELYNKQIISINLSEIISGTRYRGEFEEKINNLIKEVESNKNIILFIDEIHTLIGAGGAEGAIDASNILKPYLARNKIKLRDLCFDRKLLLP